MFFATNLIMRPHYRTQLALYSLPVVNLFVRSFQSNHYFDALRQRRETLDQFKEHQQIYRNAITNSYKIQAALFITTLALAILFPPGGVAFSFASTVFFLSIPNLWILDKRLYQSRCIIVTTGEDKQVLIA